MDRYSCTTNAQTVDTSVGRFGIESIRASRFYSSRPGNLPTGSREDDLESVYSCDSTIERIEGGDDDDSDPYDLRTKVYLDKQLEEMGYPGKDPMQLYADSKISEVLARGTITEKKRRGNLEKLKKSLPVHRINTPDFLEANKIIGEIESALEKKRGFTTATDAFESIKAMIESEFNEQNVRFDNTGSSTPGFNDVVEVRKLAMEVLLCDLEEDDGKQGDDDLNNFGEFMSSRIMGGPSSIIKECTERPTVENEELNGSEYLKEKKCPEYLDSEEEIITTKRLILMFKKRIYKVFHNHVTMMKSSKNLMTFELFRIWNKNQEQGLLEMAQDIVRREHDLRVTIKKILHSKRKEKIKTAQQRKDASQPVVVPERPGIKSRTKKAADCIRKREKLLRAKQDTFFLSGVLNGKIKCKGMLSKVWPKEPIRPGMPPLPPRGNTRVIDVLDKSKESNKRLITYGDMLRLLQQEGEFIQTENSPSEPVDSSPQASHIEEEESLGGQIISSFMNEESERDCPLVTKREYEDYLKILNELFFPEPDFKRIKETISFNPNAFVCERPQSLNMSYSLEQLEKDTERVFGFHGHLARAVYFFRYKSEYAAVDIQDAFERYVYENNAMDSKFQEHPFGCLLLYSNVAQGIAMVEGAALHVFNHFAGFRYSPIYKMIKTGRILYVREKVSRHYFRKWISIVVAPPLGVVTYLTASKKILNRVAEPRLYHFKEKLERFYRIMSNKKIGETYLSVGENSMLMAPNPLLLFESCYCHTKKEEESKRELHVPVMDLLPSPALVSYLLKYKSLKSLNAFLDELFMQPELESDDETYNIVENTVLSNYVEGDEDENNRTITKEIKKLCREREILGKLKKELDANMAKDTKGKDQPEWTKEYDIHSFNPQLVKVQVRKTEGSDIIEIDELADTEEESEKEDQERFVQISYDNNKFKAQRRFVNFVQTGSEAWQKKIKRFGLQGEEVKEMLQDARNYKKLQKVMQVLVKEKVSDAEVDGEVEAVPEEEEEEDGVGMAEEDGEERGSAESDIGWDSAVEELEKVLEQEAPEEFICEQMEWPVPFAQHGEGHEFSWEGKFDEYYGEHPEFDWNWKTDPGQPIDLLEGDERNYIPQSAESFRTDRTVENPEEEEESMLQAPPTSYVSHSSTDP